MCVNFSIILVLLRKQTLISTYSFLLLMQLKSQIRFHKNYYISYDWDQIFKSKTPTVPRIAVHKQYDFTFLTSKELNAKYKELKKEMSLPN